MTEEFEKSYQLTLVPTWLFLHGLSWKPGVMEELSYWVRRLLTHSLLLWTWEAIQQPEHKQKFQHLNEVNPKQYIVLHHERSSEKITKSPLWGVSGRGRGGGGELRERGKDQAMWHLCDSGKHEKWENTAIIFYNLYFVIAKAKWG